VQLRSSRSFQLVRSSSISRGSTRDFPDEFSALLSFDCSHSFFDAPSGLARPSHIENAILLAAQFVVIHEEFFEFRYEFLSQIIHVLDVRVTQSNLRVLANRRTYEDTYLGRSRPYGKFPLSSSMDSNSRPCSVCLATYKP
jgi:hypothetical protein